MDKRIVILFFVICTAFAGIYMFLEIEERRDAEIDRRNETYREIKL